MKQIFVESKQISFVGYDDEKREMSVYYPSGDVHTYGSVPQEDYSSLVASENTYDTLIQLTRGKRPEVFKRRGV